MLLFKSILTNINKTQCRNISFRKIKNWYANLHNAHKHEPPYNHIVQIGDPLLRIKAETVPVDLIKSDEIKFLITSLKSVLHKYDCAGISASQIGIPLRVFVMEFGTKRTKEFSPEIYKQRKMRTVPFTVFINPEMRVVNYQKIVLPEACESVKGFSADVARYAEVEVTGYNEDGKEIKVEADGWTARIIQHEMDHLGGKMYTDFMDRTTLQCTCWHVINERGGKVELPYSPS